RVRRRARVRGLCPCGPYCRGMALRNHARHLNERGGSAMLNDPLVLILLYFVMPLWLLAGFADWFCHRASQIETTSGPKESLLHLLQFSEVGVPILAALFLEINAGIIALM